MPNYMFNAHQTQKFNAKIEKSFFLSFHFLQSNIIPTKWVLRGCMC